MVASSLDVVKLGMYKTTMFYSLAGDDNDGAPQLSREDMDQLLLDPSR